MFLFIQHQFCSLSFGGCSILGAITTCHLKSTLSRWGEGRKVAGGHTGQVGSGKMWYHMKEQTRSTGQRRGEEEDDQGYQDMKVMSKCASFVCHASQMGGNRWDTWVPAWLHRPLCPLSNFLILRWTQALRGTPTPVGGRFACVQVHTKEAWS